MIDNKTLAKHRLKPYNVTPDQAMELIQDLQRSRQALKDVLEWVNSEDVRGAFAMAYIHGFSVTQERTNECRDMWKRIAEEAGE